MDVASLKRPELQKLAKKHGIKANQKNEKLIKALSEILSATSQSPAANKENTLPAKSKKRGRGKKNVSSEISITSVESDVSKGEVSCSKSDIPMTDTSNYNSSIMSEITPDWNELDLNDLMELSVESAAPPATMQVTQGEIRRSSRSSSRNRTASTTPGKAKVVANINQPATPKSSDSLKEAGKTFSIPKNRTKSKITNKESSIGRKSVVKRHSNEQANSIQAKKTRASNKWKKDMEDAVLSAVEKKLGRPSQLRQNSNKSTPLFTAKGVTTGKPTGIFTKAHKKGFGKLESIDDYQKRKEERAEMLLGSGRKRDVLSRLAKPKTPSAKNTRTSILTPANNKKSAQKGNRKSSVAGFKPSVTSTSRINTNFGSTRSKLATPKKVTVSFAKSPSKLPKPKFQTPVDRSKRSSRVSLTPFKPIISNTPTSTSKISSFDLQESLKKPLSWVPHKGPLKKFEDPTKVSLQQRFKNARNPKTSSREKRRQDRDAARNNTKSSQMMKRRGIK